MNSSSFIHSFIHSSIPFQFLSSLVERVRIGPTETRVAAVTFSNLAQMRISLNKYTTLKPLQEALEVILIVYSEIQSMTIVSIVDCGPRVHHDWRK